VTAKGFRIGTHRSVAPEDTLRRIEPLLEEMGITRVADITGLDCVGIPVMAAYRPDAWSLAVSMGKGATPAAARASAVMESLELWHAERPALPRLWGSATSLSSDHRVVEWRRLTPAEGCALDAVTETAWVEASSLGDGEPVLVPYEAVHTDGRVPEPAGSGWFACTSNGLASGNTTAEAQVHALCELIERDAITLWRLAGDPDTTAVHLDTITDPVGRWLLDRFDEAGLAVLVHNATSDLGVPTFHCTVFEPHPDAERLVHASAGMGCHPAPEVALARALTEAAQSRVTLISGARDDLFRSRYEHAADARQQWALLAKRWQAAARAGRSFGELPDLATHSLEGDRDVIVRTLVERGFEACWVDLGLPAVDVCVGRAVVAGLEHLTDVAAYRPGRRARQALVASR
jgi:ribosomal protein S12 methylthiotransferase accessory factor